MNDADKAYLAYSESDAPDEDHFIWQQLRGLAALVIVVLALWMIVLSVIVV